jgi:hypothetical protein
MSVNPISAYGAGKIAGVVEERERIIKLWELEMTCDCEDAMGHLRQRIGGENK